MGRAYQNQLSKQVVDVAAGAAANGTTYYYTEMRGYGRSSTEITIAGAGTVTVTIEGTSEDRKGDTYAASATYVDMSSDVLGAASITASALATDSIGITGCVTWVRHKVVVASSDGTTAYNITFNRTA